MTAYLDSLFGDLSASVAAAESQKGRLEEAARTIAGSIAGGGTLLICGNGGSAAEAQHFAAEFVGRFLAERPGLPAVSLAADSSKLTAIGNDYGFAEVFARQVRALGRPGDVLWAMSTSGTSPNVVAALAAARERGLSTLFMCGSEIADPGIADTVILAPAPSTPRIQELHLFYGHALCDLTDRILFSGGETA
ncbi:MAG: SIS domain-containing protein [Deltaproteobacteria bacterium]|nr:SIS domain-containing protein [Deltaproteobacteria bacterium]